MSTSSIPRLSLAYYHISPVNVLTEPPSPPATNPSDTAKLWSVVRKKTMSQLPRLGRQADRRGRGRGATASPHDTRDGPASPPSPPMTSIRALSIASSTTNTVPRGTRVNVRSPRFKELILQPRRIDIDTTMRTHASPFAHFGTEAVDYRQLDGLAHIDAWVDGVVDDFELISEEYRAMKLQELCEAEFAAFGKESFFNKGQRRSVRLPEDSLLRIERLIQPVCIPNNDTWQVPLALSAEDDTGGSCAWAGDVRPDCSYWLSLRGFNYEYFHQVQTVTHVRFKSVCPYLTIEFKRDGESEDIAIAQVASAGAIALYNRFRLYRSAIAAKNDQWTPIPVINLQHYGITFVGSQYVVWILRVRVDEDMEWDGCIMERLYTADCSDHWVAVRELTRWINEIHRWGLTVHGAECKDEIKAVLRGSGVRTSDLRMSAQHNVFHQ